MNVVFCSRDRRFKGLGIVPKIDGSNAGLDQRVTGKLLVNPAVNGYFFGLGKKPAKGKGWVLSFICCTQDTDCHYHLPPQRPLCYGKPLPFLSHTHEERSDEIFKQEC